MRRRPHRLIRVCVPHRPMSKRGSGPQADGDPPPDGRRRPEGAGEEAAEDPGPSHRKDFVKDSMDFSGEGG